MPFSSFTNIDQILDGGFLHFLAEILNGLPEYRAVEAAVETHRLPFFVNGLSNVHKAHIIYGLCLATGKRALIIAGDEQEAVRICDDLNEFFGEGAYYYPARDYNLRPVEGASHEYEHERLRILGKMARGEYRAVVACADAAMQLTIPREDYISRSLEIRLGREIKPEAVIRSLLDAGYTSSVQVEGRGQFAHRGGIVDFFAPDCENPIRIEFWGDEPNSISFFDCESQRRTENMKSASITPAAEVHFGSPEILKEAIEKFLKGVKGKGRSVKTLEADIETLRGGVFPGGIDRYLPICYEKPGTLFSFAEDALLFVSEGARVKERANNTIWQHGEDISLLLEEGVLISGLDRFYLSQPELLSMFDRCGAVYLESFSRPSLEEHAAGLTSINARQLSVWSGSVKLLCEDLQEVVDGGGRAVVFAGTEKNCATLAKELADEGFTVSAKGRREPCPPKPGTVYVIPGKLSSGLEYPSLKLTLITSGKTGVCSGRKARHKAGERIRNLAELSVGDYVVHTSHGIGVYEGIHKLEVQGIVKDYIKIRYAGKDTLYVPVTQLDLVSKYIGVREDGTVRLNRMGGTDWQKTKNRVRSAIKDMAKDLIALYAARQQVEGVAFPEDDDIQRDFEDRFEYEETEDQLRCSAEIKEDMQKAYPMDRLLCGDVGFGKTEVALRAVFKCVEAGFQSALLVPTTILAWQHYQTIRKRFEGFPVRVELLSRFRSHKQQEEILSRMHRGQVDIVVGTHRLVQKDVEFRKLGLVIVDEEQRFGVAQKEKLKEKFRSVDVLTLSATPIPRTLNMALSGIRDMSIIEEAPQDRQPVQTYVLEHDWSIVIDAIKKELRRGGQVYYLHNRIETIEAVAGKIASFLPEARIGVAHGKMDEEELSRVWEDLLEGRIDILVCTTIIETGVDVPNVNTLIIEEADHMGLSQLHQIRGRVGRSPRRAFAYFTFKKGKALSDVSTKRLTAIREFTEFGSGFQIAMRDMEIRGAGNILGAQQHGHLEAVGYDMYLKLLNEAVLEEKGEKPVKEDECMVDIQMSAHIPEEYIGNANQRLEIYRRIADIRDKSDADDVIDELIDRFGDPPDTVKSLVDVSLLRNTAASFGIREISQRGSTLLLYCEAIDLKAVSGLVSSLRGRVMVNAGQRPYISVKLLPSQSPVDGIRQTLKLLGEGN